MVRGLIGPLKGVIGGLGPFKRVLKGVKGVIVLEVVPCIFKAFKVFSLGRVVL